MCELPHYPIGGKSVTKYSMQVAQHRANAETANGLSISTRIAIRGL